MIYDGEFATLKPRQAAAAADQIHKYSKQFPKPLAAATQLNYKSTPLEKEEEDTTRKFRSSKK
jgi:hypothetical protein